MGREGQALLPRRAESPSLQPLSRLPSWPLPDGALCSTLGLREAIDQAPELHSTMPSSTAWGLRMLLDVPGLDQGAPSSPRAPLPACHPLFSLPRAPPSLGMSSALRPAPGSLAALPSLPAGPFQQLALCGQPPQGSSLKPVWDAPLCRGASTPPPPLLFAERGSHFRACPSGPSLWLHLAVSHLHKPSCWVQ